MQVGVINSGGGEDQDDNRVIVSFCIPTLNRAREIAVCLASIAAQADSAVEVVIVDGGSKDGTRAVIETFRNRLPLIRVLESETHAGVDQDILQSVAAASGDYCWLFSDDDILLPNSLAVIRRALTLNEDVAGISVNYTAYDPTLCYRIATVPALSGGGEADILFTRNSEAFSRLGVHFGFISCQLVRRSLWLKAVAQNDVASQCNSWIIVYMIGKMLELHPRWKYLQAICVGYRSGNDSFIARVGVIRRQHITHANYAHTIGSLFPSDSDAYRQVFRILLRERMARTLAVQKANGMSISVHVELFRLYFGQYRSYPDFWLRVFPVFFVPNALLRWVRRAYMWNRQLASS
jgi:abequosyltransferase